MIMGFISVKSLAQTKSEANILTDDLVISLEMNEESNQESNQESDQETNEEVIEIDESETDEVADENDLSETPIEELEQNPLQHIAPTSFVTVTSEAELIAAISAGTEVITLGANIYTSDGHLNIPADADITLEGNFALSSTNAATGSFITIESNARLTIDGVRIEASSSVADFRGIYVSDSAELILLDGSISGFNSNNGAGVYIANGRFEMYGGEISGNYGSEGGGVFTDHGVFEMYGGSINGNSAENGGGGLFVVSDGSNTSATFIMHGGEISGNTALNHGGGLYLVHATFDMWGGQINNNIAENEYGGGIILDADGVFNMYDGEISGNSGMWGGGVATHGGKIIMHNGKITNNTAELGGGIHDEFFWDPNVSVIYGGEISENMAELGGGIYMTQGAPLLISNAVISDNTATLGGGIYVTNGTTLNVIDASAIINNTAQSGGGIYTMDVGTYSNLATASTVVFSGNNASVAYEPPINAEIDYPNIQYASSSIQVAGTYWNPINNFDINFSGTAPAYFVHYFANGGTGTHTTVSSENAIYTILSNTETGISRTGYNFANWNTEANGSGMSYAPGDTITITSTVNLYAQWTPAPSQTQYHVHYFANGGTGSYTHNSAGSTVHTVLNNTQADISRTGYNFTNWNTEANGNGTFYSAGDTVTITSNINLYAQWVPAISPPSNLRPSTSHSRPLQPTQRPASTPSTHPPSSLPPYLPQPPLPSRQAYLIGIEGYIHPKAKITRAEVATIFFRLISDDMRMANWSQTNPYPDVTIENWFNNAVSTTTQLGIFRGRLNGTFAPTQFITRAELTAAVVRFMSIAGISDVEEDLFNDIHGHWANAYINTAAINNWVQGYDGHGGVFHPDHPITRAETVAIINRIFNRLPQSTADLLPDMITWPDNTDTNAWYYLYIQAASNSYTFEMKPGDIYEQWIAIIPRHNWKALERPDSTPTGLWNLL